MLAFPPILSLLKHSPRQSLNPSGRLASWHVGGEEKHEALINKRVHFVQVTNK